MEHASVSKHEVAIREGLRVCADEWLAKVNPYKDAFRSKAFVDAAAFAWAEALANHRDARERPAVAAVEIRRLDERTGVDLSVPNTGHYVYVLISGGDIAYVGVTSSLRRRLGQHHRNRKIDSWYAAEYGTRQEADAEESRLIRELCPVWNAA